MKPYMHGNYQLYARDVELKNNNGTHRIYFFARNTPKSGAPSPLPNGYKVEVSDRTGLPLLRKDPGASTAAPGFFGSVRKLFN